MTQNTLNNDYFVILTKYYTNTDLIAFVGVTRVNGVFVAGLYNTENEKTSLLLNPKSDNEYFLTFAYAEQQLYFVCAGLNITKMSEPHEKNLKPEEVANIVILAAKARFINENAKQK